MPHAVADVARRRSSSRRSVVRATSMPPHVVLTPSSTYWRWLSSVRNAISLLWSVGKMKFEAWPVDPPGFGRGPLSTSTMSDHPSRARWPTRQLPTMPAPITTTLAVGPSPGPRSWRCPSCPIARRIGFHVAERDRIVEHSSCVAGVQSVERAFAVLRCLAEPGRPACPRSPSGSSCRRAPCRDCCRRCRSWAPCEQATDGTEYRVGDLVVEIAGGGRPGRGLIALARPFLVELAETVGEAAGLSVLDGREMLYVDQVDVDRPVQLRDWTGVRIPAHAVPPGSSPWRPCRRRPRDAYLGGPARRRRRPHDDRCRRAAAADPAHRPGGHGVGDRRSTWTASTRWPRRCSARTAG